MLKLYKMIDGKLNYWETWDIDNQLATIHSGVVGEKGQSENIKSGLFSNFRKKVQEQIFLKLEDGFKEINIENFHKLVIEYKISGVETDSNLDKRHRLEQKMNEVLGWAGLGHCDGGSIGGDTMEILCLVVDFDIAKKVIEKELQNTEFENYLRIYNENL